MSKHNNDDTIAPIELPSIEHANRAYQYLFELAELHIKLQWTRANVMLVVQGSILALIANKQFYGDAVLRIMLVCFGLSMAFLMLRTTKGGSFWVSHFEQKMKAIEQVVIGPHISIYGNNPHYEQDIRKKSRSDGYRSTRKSLEHMSFSLIFIWIFVLFYLIFPDFIHQIIRTIQEVIKIK
jgi:hypothetical protein